MDGRGTIHKRIYLPCGLLRRIDGLTEDNIIIAEGNFWGDQD